DFGWGRSPRGPCSPLFWGCWWPISLAPSRARRPSSAGTTCTSSCTTAVTCSASPATDRAGIRRPMLMRTLLVRGMLAGLAAAALALIFAWILGEPQIGHAIAFEDQQARLAGAPPPPAPVSRPAPELVSRTVQETFGLAVAVGLVGLALGGLFSIVFAICYGRIGRFGPRATSALVAAGAFVAVELVPFLKYPANPPSVGNPATI